MGEFSGVHGFCCGIAILIIFILYFITNRILNIRKSFVAFYIVSVVLSITFFLTFGTLKTHEQHVIHWVLPMPFVILTLYKWMDDYMLLKHNRHIIFYYKTWGGKGQMWKELLFQISLILACIVTLVIVNHYTA